MNEEKIKEMAKVLDECCNRYDEDGNFLGNKCSNCEYFCDTNHLCCSYGEKEATSLYNAGYCKQSEGEWVEQTYGELKCSECGIVQEDYPHRYNYCPNCGARMSGGQNEKCQ